MTAVQRKCAGHVAGKTRRDHRRICDEVRQPEPREAAKRHLERARPVDADGGRILLLPVVPLAERLVQEPLLRRQAKRLRQRHQMLMSTQFPGDLDVPDFLEIEKGNVEPRLLRGTFSVDGVEAPVDGGPVVEPFIAQKIESVGADAVPRVRWSAPPHQGALRRLPSFASQLGEVVGLLLRVSAPTSMAFPRRRSPDWRWTPSSSPGSCPTACRTS